jgi:hypothetical protein
VGDMIEEIESEISAGKCQALQTKHNATKILESETKNKDQDKNLTTQ